MNGEDMNAIIAKQGKKKHGPKYMDAARAMAQEKGRKLTPMKEINLETSTVTIESQQTKLLQVMLDLLHKA